MNSTHPNRIPISFTPVLHLSASLTLYMDRTHPSYRLSQRRSKILKRPIFIPAFVMYKAEAYHYLPIFISIPIPALGLTYAIASDSNALTYMVSAASNWQFGAQVHAKCFFTHIGKSVTGHDVLARLYLQYLAYQEVTPFPLQSEKFVSHRPDSPSPVSAQCRTRASP